MMNKRGSIFDFLYIPIIMFLAVIALIVSFIVLETTTHNASELTNNTESKIPLTNARQTLLNMDNMMLFVLIVASFSVVISSFFVHNHAAFFIIGVFLLAVILIIIGSIQNAYETFATNTHIVSTIALFPKTNLIMNNLVFYLMGMGFMSLVVGAVGSIRGGQ